EHLVRLLGHEGMTTARDLHRARAFERRDEFPSGPRRRHDVALAKKEQDWADHFARSRYAVRVAVASGEVRVHHALFLPLHQPHVFAHHPEAWTRVARILRVRGVRPDVYHVLSERLVVACGGE